MIASQTMPHIEQDPPNWLIWRKSSRSDSGPGQCVEIAAWRSSARSASGGNANCVEVGAAADTVAVRDSKRPTGPVLTAPATDWKAMLTAIKHGHLDA
ncbi:uncharacterized protein DUF397 [Stackebrandtia albiflava]|uniref:Uncharacterized protein DUF397 n=1 Tax=Stackebrandtia albiflava TaxID=406432 RepID=A0A562URF6_9ACTN|nr:DUF397 domain-containing protein [Stackebrandtia albiflava]TWJ08193.1 uncharacterized protein DUF397 [Stackebrandtia albiflava]